MLTAKRMFLRQISSLVLGFGLLTMVLAFTSCERHVWDGETSKLFKPHDSHSEEGTHSSPKKDSDAHHGEKHSSSTGHSSPKPEASAETGTAARKLFPR